MRISTPRPTSLLFRSSDSNDSQRISFLFFRSEIDRIKITYGEIIRKLCLLRCLSLDAGSKFQIQISATISCFIREKKKRPTSEDRDPDLAFPFYFFRIGETSKEKGKQKMCERGKDIQRESSWIPIHCVK